MKNTLFYTYVFTIEHTLTDAQKSELKNILSLQLEFFNIEKISITNDDKIWITFSEFTELLCADCTAVIHIPNHVNYIYEHLVKKLNLKELNNE